MKKTLIFLLGLSLILNLTSCSNETQETNTKIQNENISLNDENLKLKQELESYKKENSINSTSTGNIQKQEENPLPAKQEISKEDIKLAGCEETKKVGEVEWCMKNSELIKDVEGYETRFSKSIQNDSGFKGIYETDNEDKLYTYNYLEKACGVIDGEGIITDGFVNMSCPCPRGFHIPTTKEWNDTYEYYKLNVDLFKSELGFTKNAWVRKNDGYILKLEGVANIYHTNSLGSIPGTSQLVNLYAISIFADENGIGNAYPLRCVKNN